MADGVLFQKFNIARTSHCWINPNFERADEEDQTERMSQQANAALLMRLKQLTEIQAQVDPGANELH